MFAIFEMTNPLVGKNRVFKDHEFATPKAAIEFLATVGPVVDVEYEGSDFANVCHGRALNVYTVEAL